MLRMLKQRIITAVLLLAVFLPTLILPSIEPFALFTLVLIAAAGWEWARLNGCGPQRALAAGLALAVGLLAFWLSGGVERSWRELWLVVGVLWMIMAAALLYRGVDAYARWPQMLRLWLGLFLIACAWLALVQARLLGLGFLLSVLLLVWVADIAAYFGGKRFGRRYAVPALLGLVAMSVAGDLVESLVKRAAGVKDSSQLLPGHGGVLDRVDALLPVLPLAMMLVTL